MMALQRVANEAETLEKFASRDTKYSHTPTFWTHLLFGQLGAWRQGSPTLNLVK